MVHFVGAGSGAADLITVRGAKLLGEADVVIYAGSLVNPALLDYTREGCEIHDSAKLTLEEVIALIEKAEAAVDEKKAQELAEKLKKNRFTLTDYLDQLNSMKNMGSLQELAGMVPGLDAKALAGAKIDEKAMAHTEAIILSMTPAERENPSILNSSRKRRIAAGAGVGVVDINRLLKQFEMMQTMARQLSGKKMKRFQRGGGKMPFGF